ncbi:site-specific DNA-methyltransferase [Bacillus sp. FSL W7-1360]
MDLNKIYHDDCLHGMRQIPDASVDMILCDPPYGITDNDWDTQLPLGFLWQQYKRIIKDHGAIVLTATQPFATALISYAPDIFRYSLVWDKKIATNFLNARRMPMRRHEDILVFYKKLPTYNPQKTPGKPYKSKTNSVSTNYGEMKPMPIENPTGERNPTTILEIPNKRVKGGHATQKPVELFEWLIKTYTNPGDLVLDSCMGSGTTAVAAKQLGRDFIGFEMEKDYVKMANDRLENTVQGASLQKDERVPTVL